LRPGMTASADIVTATQASALSVPIQAVTVRTLEQLGKDAAKQGYTAGKDGFAEVVWVMADDKVKARQVTTGIQGEDAIEVKTGLKEGETVVSGSYRAISRDLENDMEVQLKKPGKPGEGKDDEKAKD
jgi:HlyD family secretion protein